MRAAAGEGDDGEPDQVLVESLAGQVAYPGVLRVADAITYRAGVTLCAILTWVRLTGDTPQFPFLLSFSRRLDGKRSRREDQYAVSQASGSLSYSRAVSRYLPWASRALASSQGRITQSLSSCAPRCTIASRFSVTARSIQSSWSG